MPPIFRMIRMMTWPNVEYVSTILTGDNPVTLIPDTATNKVSIGLTLTLGLWTNGKFNNKMQ